MNPFDDDRRLRALSFSLFAHISTEDDGNNAANDGGVGYKTMSLKVLTGIIAHEGGHNISPLFFWSSWIIIC